MRRRIPTWQASARHAASKRATLRLLLALAVLAVALGACRGGVIDTERVVALDANAPRGASLIEDYGCGACHTVPGIVGANGRIAPPLDFWADRAWIAGAVPNVPDNLILWIQNPQAIEPNTAMPILGVSEDHARDIAAYLYTIR